MPSMRRPQGGGINLWRPLESFWEEFTQAPLFDNREVIRGTAADVYESGDDIVVEMSLPGVKPEDISTSLTGDSLTVSGETKEETQEKERDYYQRQIRYGRISQSIVLPNSVKAEKVNASFNQGLLKLTLPKSEEAKPKRINLKVSEPKKLKN